ncbi:MAG: dUTP diphosphatase [Defluviitaleaceae bacterium]|nr:dUTP diphosphatase [Defluviitaleaceae bacterium]
MADNFLIQRTADAYDLPLPARATPLSSGLDLHANVHEDVKIPPGERKLIPTGIKISLPMGYEAQIRPRSGLALNAGIGIPNSPATIDADYRGELKVILINWGTDPFIVRRGERIAQLVVCSIAMVDFNETCNLPDSVRGEGGFGHTGIGYDKKVNC